MDRRSAFRKKLSALRKAVNAYKAYVGGSFPTVKAAWFLTTRAHRMGRTLAFIPRTPDQGFMVRHVCSILGYHTTSAADRPADLVMYWEDDTYPKAPVEVQALAHRRTVLNAHVTDISKVRISALMTEVFGYSADVDPTVHEGNAIRKMNLNAMDDEAVIECPISAEQVDPHAVYQQVLGTVVEGLIQEFRFTWMDGDIAVVVERLRRPERRFIYNGSLVSIKPVEEVYSQEERERIKTFLEHMRLDFGEVDTMRDEHGRIHIIDVNPTAWGRLMGNDPTPAGPALLEVAKRLERMVSREVEAGRGRLPLGDDFRGGRTAGRTAAKYTSG